MTGSDSGPGPGGSPASPGSGAGAAMPRGDSREAGIRVADLLAAVEGAERVLVLTHDNPDPDALASAAGLAFLLERTGGLETSLAFGGIIGRAENRALVQEMGVRFQRVDLLQEPAGTAFALVDTQPRAGNNSLPAGRIASIVVDHHPLRPETAASPFSDVRPESGSSCSILVEYLRAAGLEPDRRLAAALFYGIQSETMDLGREVSAADVEASLYLYPRSDAGAISRIRHARVPAGYLRCLHEALAEARRYGSVVLAPLGRLEYPDMVAEVADLFMRVEGVEWTLAVGRYGDRLLLSLRTDDPYAHAGALVRKVIGGRGSAGGHGGLAGAQIDVRNLPGSEVGALREQLVREFLGELGVEGTVPEPLVGTAPGGSPSGRGRGAGSPEEGAGTPAEGKGGPS